MMAKNRIVELASIISSNTAAVDQYLTSHGHPTPTLDVSAPAHLPIDPVEAGQIEQARRAVIEATDELSALMKGPAELLRVGVRFTFSPSALHNSHSHSLPKEIPATPLLKPPAPLT